MSLIECLGAIVLLGIIAGAALPATYRWYRRIALWAAVVKVRGVLNDAKERAGTLDRETGVKFTQYADGWWYAVYEDGDGDGVLNSDIASGVDRVVVSPRPFVTKVDGARIGIAGGVRDPDSGALLAADTGVRFGVTGICSFAPGADATPGTIFLTNDVITAAVRSSGDGAAIKTLVYDDLLRTWSGK